MNFMNNVIDVETTLLQRQNDVVCLLGWSKLACTCKIAEVIFYKQV